MFKNYSKTLMLFAFIPIVIWLTIGAALQYTHAAHFGYETISLGVLLLITGYGVSTYKRKWTITSIITMIIMCLGLFISGFFNEKFYLVETVIAIILLIYYSTLHYFNYWMVKNKDYLKKINDYFTM